MAGESVNINHQLEKEGFIVAGDIVIVEDYQFMIDREKLEIMYSLGKGNENTNIEIMATPKVAEDKMSCMIEVVIHYAGEISYVMIDGKEIKAQDGVYTLEVSQNGKYGIFVKDDNNGYKIASVDVIGLLGYVEEIWSIADLIQFRDGVNAKLNYEGRTVILQTDLDLTEVGNWIPIGYKNESDYVSFNGIFEGKNHTIINLKIQNERGFFCAVVGGTVKNLNFENVNVVSNQRITGTVIGELIGTLENVNVRSGSIVVNAEVSGGIVGAVTFGSMVNCTNEATVSSTEYIVGGITGQVCRNN